MSTSAISDKSPHWRDYLIFYALLPLCLSIFFASFEIRLVSGMPFLDSVVYMAIHITAAWWGLDLGSRLIHFLCRLWQPPPAAIISMSFFLMLVPLTIFYQTLGDFYAARFDSFAAARVDSVTPSWTLAYVLHFLRFSITALPMFIAAVYGYEYVTGVGWYRYPQQGKTQNLVAGESSSSDNNEQPLAQLLVNSQLPPDAVLHAIKAEEHYVRIWSDQGTDFIRYRFQDVAKLLEPCDGLRVHRSWWINPSVVKQSYKKGRSLELELVDGLKVPVSLAYKAIVISELLP